MSRRLSLQRLSAGRKDAKGLAEMLMSKKSRNIALVQTTLLPQAPPPEMFVLADNCMA